MTNTGAVISRYLVSPNSADAAKRAALLKMGQCGKADNHAGTQVGDQQQRAATADDEHS
jgi:hypothetical protein